MKKLLEAARLVPRITVESSSMAISSIKNDKFRTILSLLGVSIGIFSIVAVFCAVDALKSNINEGLSTFGSDVIYIQKWPFTSEEGDGEMKWWEYRLRPEVTENEYRFLMKHSKTAESICYISEFYALAKSGGNSFSEGFAVAASPEFEKLMNITLEDGRYFSPAEMRNGANVAVIGSEVASVLFGGSSDAVGHELTLKGAHTTVIGVMKKEGSSMVSLFRKDIAIIVPLNYGKSIYDVSHQGGAILAAPGASCSEDEFQCEMRQLMRAHRRLIPTKKDDFAINSMTFLVDAVDKITAAVEKVGWIIACFSLLIGGFGIANIMFVSVKERTNQIGIQKALGAPKYVVLTQFLVEAAALAVAGGLVGVLIVYVICHLVHPNGFTFSLSVMDALKGLSISLVIGILAGLIPAWSAAGMNPVDAINS